MGKGGAGSRGDRAAGRARVRAPLPPKAALTVGAVNRPITAGGEPAGPARPASSPRLRGGRARGGLGGGGWEESARSALRAGLRGGWPGRVRRWGGPGLGEGADAAPGLPRKV